ncbi:18496_t:CDS:1, partial [Acaulospora morrowiae]
MVGGSVSGGVSRNQSILRYLAVDPETYPLMGVLAVIFGVAGYTMGRKFTRVDKDKDVDANAVNVLKTPRTYYWHRSTGYGKPSNMNDKDSRESSLNSPAPPSEYKIRVNLPNDLAEKLPK